jgi:hypothetical protein
MRDTESQPHVLRRINQISLDGEVWSGKPELICGRAARAPPVRLPRRMDLTQPPYAETGGSVFAFRLKRSTRKSMNARARAD